MLTFWLTYSCTSCLLPLQESSGAEEQAEEASVTIEQLRHNAPVVALEWSHGDLHSGMALPAVLFRRGEPVFICANWGERHLHDDGSCHSASSSPGPVHWSTRNYIMTLSPACPVYRLLLKRV